MEITKNSLRELWLATRLKLNEPDKNHGSFEIQDRVLETFNFNDVGFVNIFLPVHNKCEVRTWSLIQYLQEKYSAVSISVPTIKDIRNREMNAVELDKHSVYIQNKWGIDEPESGKVIEPSLLNIIFIPLIAFDQQGHRLGYGGGFYDRYLINCSNAIKVGLSYFDPIQEIPEINQYDIKMDYCITPNRTYQF